jgi:hypothetical protein
MANTPLPDHFGDRLPATISHFNTYLSADNRLFFATYGELVCDKEKTGLFTLWSNEPAWSAISTVFGLYILCVRGYRPEPQ